jgi:large conductance mechanosensitive channel
MSTRDSDGPPGAGVVRGAGKELGGFKKFILRGNVVDLAVGIVIGAAFTSVVQALVKDIITPILGVFGGQPDFSAWVVPFGSSRLLIGDFLNAVISFLLIALVVVLPGGATGEQAHGALPPGATAGADQGRATYMVSSGAQRPTGAPLPLAPGR